VTIKPRFSLQGHPML